MKTQVQALDRTQPMLPMDFGKTAKRTHDYVRNGTTNLFVALNTQTGEGTFQSVRQLTRHIENYIAHWNEEAEPFTWTATPEEIISKVQILERDFQRFLDVNRNVKY